jgi:hypothetical protein
VARRTPQRDGNGPIGPGSIGPSALGDGPIGSARGAGRRARRPWAVALAAAWALLVLTLGAGAGYVWWPELRQGLGLERPAEVAGLPEVEVAPVAEPPAPAEAAPEPAPPAAAPATPPLDLDEPQSTPMPTSGGLPPEGGEAAVRLDGAPPQGPAADAGAAAPPEAADATREQGARADGADGAGAQVAALPQPPPAPAAPQLPDWRRFAAPFVPPEDRPLIAIVVTGLGLNGPRTLQAIERLPPEISLSFSPYGKQTDEFMRTARAFGHEVLLDLPMEPAGADDPGTLALLAAAGPDANLDRLDLVLSRGRGYVGVVGSLGARFVSDPLALEPVMAALAARGLMFVDNRPLDEPRAAQAAAQFGVPAAVNDRSLDARMAATPAVDASLAQVERIARERGTAVALGQPNPSTLERLAEWVKTLPGKGLALAPISAVADSQPIR